MKLYKTYSRNCIIQHPLGNEKTVGLYSAISIPTPVTVENDVLDYAGTTVVTSYCRN